MDNNSYNNQIYFNNNHHTLYDLTKKIENITNDLLNKKNIELIIKEIKNVISILNNILNYNKQNMEIKDDIQNVNDEMINKFESLNINSNQNYNNIKLYYFGEKINNLLHSHSLTYCDYLKKDDIYQKGDWICNICKCHYSKNIPDFYCKICSFDACYYCFERYKKYYIGQKQNNKNHEHILFYTDYLGKENVYEKGNWSCNICKKYYPRDCPNFYCQICNYDMCIYCFEKSI